MKETWAAAPYTICICSRFVDPKYSRSAPYFIPKLTFSLSEDVDKFREDDDDAAGGDNFFPTSRKSWQ